MPLHDWTRVPVCIFHDFRQSWILAISRELNKLFRPPRHYVRVPLEETYCDAWSGFAGRWKQVVESDPARSGGAP